MSCTSSACTTTLQVNGIFWRPKRIKNLQSDGGLDGTSSGPPQRPLSLMLRYGLCSFRFVFVFLITRRCFHPIETCFPSVWGLTICSLTVYEPSLDIKLNDLFPLRDSFLSWFRFSESVLEGFCEKRDENMTFLVPLHCSMRFCAKTNFRELQHTRQFRYGPTIWRILASPLPFHVTITFASFRSSGCFPSEMTHLKESTFLCDMIFLFSALSL